MNELVIIKNDKAVCSSLQVAESFGKNHFHVIRDIETKIIGVAEKKFTDTNFGLSTYKDDSGKSNKMYYMTRDGYALLAMGFTGKNAMEWKVRYITAFNSMESILLENQSPHWQATRLESKSNRRMETDEIKQFVQYAKDNGSKNADRYYCNLSILANKAVGIGSNSRDTATAGQLNNLILIEHIIGEVIKEGILQALYYKDIYKLCKQRIEQFKQVAYLQKVS